MNIDFAKYPDGLVPAVVQDAQTRVVLMVGFMNQEALQATIESGKVTFYSRSKQRLWTKGESSGHFLLCSDVKADCDNDTLLIQATPTGPVCHTGADTCFSETNAEAPFVFLSRLEAIIESRKADPAENSYTSRLFSKGINKVAQKLGEEAVELVIEAKDNDDDLFLNEAADLLFHYLVLLQAKGFQMAQVLEVLQRRHKG